jgi:hypothetical protein
MSTTTHTPGTWHSIESAETGIAYIVGNSAGLVAKIPDKHESAKAENAANARLLAASPDLLAMLKRTLIRAEAYYRTLPDDGPEQDYYMTTVIGPARAAIAKAEGRE